MEEPQSEEVQNRTDRAQSGWSEPSRLEPVTRPHWLCQDPGSHKRGAQLSAVLRLKKNGSCALSFKKMPGRVTMVTHLCVISETLGPCRPPLSIAVLTGACIDEPEVRQGAGYIPAVPMSVFDKLLL